MTRASVWARHPCYAATLAVLFLTTMFMLIPPSSYLEDTKIRFKMKDNSLESRVKQSHWMYDTVVKQRPGLIRKFGPTPQQIEMFPQNTAPWPAYTVWSFFPAAFDCPHEIQRLGALGDGGKWVCGLSRVQKKPDCVVYSFGINSESSFERDILSNTEHCTIYGYDFSVNSFGPEITTSLRHRTFFKPYGLSGENKHGPADKQPVYTLETLLKMNNHKHIDILKVDVEFHEFSTFTTFMKPYIASGKALPFGQLQLEIHLWNKTFDEFLQWFEMLEEAGLRPFRTEPNLIYQNYNDADHAPNLAEYSFLNVKGDNVFIKDTYPRSAY